MDLSNKVLIRDLMKYEILHQEGGFFFEEFYEPFSNQFLDRNLKYNFVGVTHQSPYWGEQMSSIFMGAS